MISSKNVEKIIRDGKPNVKTNNQLDKLIIDGSHSIMEESNSLSPKFNMLTLLVRYKIAVCVTSIVIIIIVGLLVFQPETENNITPPKVTNVTQKPAEMMSLLSINLAYSRGGLDEVEKQCEKAINKLGPRPKQLTIPELLAESNGT
jgi:hypothetical protein